MREVRQTTNQRLLKKAPQNSPAEIAGGKEDGSSFSAVMLKNKTFRDWAEASVHREETKKWFERIIV